MPPVKKVLAYRYLIFFFKKSGAGDAFCAGVTIGLTYGKSLREAADIGARLASSVITVTENVCPRFLPKELGIDLEVEEFDF